MKESYKTDASLINHLKVNGANEIYREQYTYKLATKNGIIKDIKKNDSYGYDSSKEIDLSALEGKIKTTTSDIDTSLFISETESKDNEIVCAWLGEDSKIYVIVNSFTIETNTTINGTTTTNWGYVILYEMQTEEDLNSATSTAGTSTVVTTIKDTKTSTAGQLRSSISTWYKTLRVIALVGLLSVLVYVGIRIILSSTSQEKAKYKNMVTDWVVAICLLFVLHYIMAFTMQITESILGIFSENTSIVGNNGQDVLMSDVRQDLSAKGIDSENPNFATLFSKIIIYIALVIYTVMFVLQYLKRVVWLAFLTMIAPLITLTYPIDKIKDGKAQAFTMWIREYVFNALLPVIHIILYYMLVGSAMNFITTGGNWLYAIVAVGFLMQAEKFFRKMFGFDQASSAGALGAAAGGALVMNAINKMGQKSGKQAAGGSGSSGGNSTGKSTTGVRTDDGSALAALNGGVNPGGTNPGGTNSGFSATLKDKWNNAPRPIKGVANLAKNQLFTRSAAQRNLRAMGKVVGGAAGLTAGLAAGVSTGDFGKALQYGVAGVAGGAAAGGGLANAGFNAYDSTVKGIDNIRYGYDEGAYGEEEAQNRQFDREFKRSEDYKKMLKNYPGHEKDIDSMLKAGITDPTRMNTILKATKDNIRFQDAMAYNQLATSCSDSILHDKNKFREFLTDRGIDQSRYNDSELANLRKNIAYFK